MIKTNNASDSKNIPAWHSKDGTDALLEEWFSLPAHERNGRFIDTARAAEIAGVTRRTIEAWIDVGEIAALCVGRKLHVHQDSLRRRIELEARFWAAGDLRPAREAWKRAVRDRSI